MRWLFVIAIGAMLGMLGADVGLDVLRRFQYAITDAIH